MKMTYLILPGALLIIGCNGGTAQFDHRCGKVGGNRTDVYGQSWGMFKGELVAVTKTRTDTGPDGRSLTVTTDLKTGTVISRIDIYGNSWGIVGGTLIEAIGSKKIIGPNGTEQMQTCNLKTGATISGLDVLGNEWSIDNQGKLGVKGAFVMTAKYIGSGVIDGTDIYKMKDLLTDKIYGTDIFGNLYRIETGDKLGRNDTIIMTAEYLGNEVISGTEVTKMKDLLTGKIYGTDIVGNMYMIKATKLTAMK